MPFCIDSDFARELLEESKVMGIIVYGIKGKELLNYKKRIDYFNSKKSSWKFPSVEAKVLVYIGSNDEIGISMLFAAFNKDIREIVYIYKNVWKVESIKYTLINIFFDKVAGILKKIMEFIFCKIELIVIPIISLLGNKFKWFSLSSDRSMKKFAELIFSPYLPILSFDKFTKGKIVHVNSALACGGAERQVVNTLIGLKQLGTYNVSIVCERLHDFDDSDFYLLKLQGMGITTKKLKHVTFENMLDTKNLENFNQHFKKIPTSIKQAVINYAYEFYYSRPEVVHLWQDSTNIIAGIAACIVGVPRIILSTRNMAPFRFGYFQRYMKPAYMALSYHPNVKFINNSNAGMNDYLKWLNLSEDSFSVIHNGINRTDIKAVSIDKKNEFRQKYGLPNEVIVIGSIFRFYAEKDPLLWINTAAEIIKRSKNKNIIFLLIGAGPLMTTMQDLILKHGLSDKVIMPGVMKIPAVPLSLMDIFLLTSINEGTPNVVIEAQLSGIPVVSTDAGGVRDAIKNSITGWIVDSRSPIDLAEKVLELLDDKKSLVNTCKNASLFAEKSFGMERMISETLNYYGI